jgi:hypothetical protein
MVLLGLSAKKSAWRARGSTGSLGQGSCGAAASVGAWGTPGALGRARGDAASHARALRSRPRCPLSRLAAAEDAPCASRIPEGKLPRFRPRMLPVPVPGVLALCWLGLGASCRLLLLLHVLCLCVGKCPARAVLGSLCACAARGWLRCRPWMSSRRSHACRQTNSFVENSIEAGILLCGNGESRVHSRVSRAGGGHGCPGVGRRNHASTCTCPLGVPGGRRLRPRRLLRPRRSRRARAAPTRWSRAARS